jgi:hypothetical protein
MLTVLRFAEISHAPTSHRVSSSGRRISAVLIGSENPARET